MTITQAEALTIVSLDSMKTELRIQLSETAHDALLSEQIHSAAIHAAKTTGVARAELPLLRAAIVSSVRAMYDGNRELSPNAATYAWLQPFQKLSE